MRLAAAWPALLALGPGAFAAPPADTSPPAATAMFPVYTDRSQNPAVWDGVAAGLQAAGAADAIVAIRVRPTALWTAHVDSRPAPGHAARRAIVSSDLRTWKLLCITSETETCARYGR